MQIFKSLLVISICLITLSSCTTTYYISRHAEKANSSGNTPLSTAGFARADALRDTLINKGIDNIFVSTALRTQQTAAPTAQAISITPVIEGSTQDLIQRLKNMRDQRQVLVVGHSNTVPQIIDALMDSPQNIQISENEFDNLFIIRVARNVSINRTLLQRTYGVPTP
jgi:broad specificity phosphatase PhoE